jgi:hypothetical protein
MTARLFDKELVLEPGLVVRVDGLKGLFRAVAPCDHNTQAFWFLPCDQAGSWNHRSGWRAFRADRCRSARRAR